MKNKEELFKSPKWTEYQSVKPTGIKVPRTKKDEENIKWFEEYIRKQIEKEKENTK